MIRGPGTGTCRVPARCGARPVQLQLHKRNTYMHSGPWESQSSLASEGLSFEAIEAPTHIMPWPILQISYFFFKPAKQNGLQKPGRWGRRVRSLGQACQKR